MSAPVRRVVAVIGAGAAGTLVAARLAREAGVRGQGLDLLLVDPSSQTGRGVAYGADHPHHRLNVPAGRISALPEREKLVIALYYYENLTLREIGEVLGVTESRISQLHTKAVLRLKSRLQGDNLRDE